VGAQVTILVSRGRPRALVPSVRGLTGVEAEDRLQRAGLRVVVVRRESVQPPGAVIGQSPEAGRRVRRRAAVRVTVAAPPSLALVPAVTGLAFERAVERASAAGFAIAFAHRRARRRDEVGRVLAQDPPAGRQVPRGARLRITVGVAR
jgi:serine/threonine-protein kinase